MKEKKIPATIEDHYLNLEAIIGSLEAENTSLEESLILYEKGMASVRSIQESLECAAQKISFISDPNGSAPED